MKNLIVIAVLSLAAFAQDAVVVELSPHEAAEVRKAYEAKQAADKAWDAIYGRIWKAHPDLNHSGGMNFSKDFRFVVPKPFTLGTAATTSGSWANWGNCTSGGTSNGACFAPQ